jgi:glycosyltransferase involved in cell wall biosynthesis
MNEDKKVSVIIPAYNAEKTIERTLNSIIGGGYRNIEVLVVNDGSTDATADIVKKYIDCDNRVRMVYQQNLGCGSAKCRGIKECSGDYIAFCDADDWFEYNFLQEHIKHLEKYKCEISMCQTHISNAIHTGYNELIEIKKKPYLVKDYIQYDGISVSLCDKVFKREVLDNDEICNDFRYADDLYMNYIACKYANSIVKFNTTKYNWFNNTSSLSRGKFNHVRIDNDFSAWKRIIGDCKKNYPELEKTARLSSELWICGTYRSMVNGHYHDKKQEDRIAKYIRQDGLEVFKAEKNKRNKAFLRIAYVSFPLARVVWYSMNGCRRVVKNLRR